jgi:hypothetical protein
LDSKLFDKKKRSLVVSISRVLSSKPLPMENVQFNSRHEVAIKFQHEDEYQECAIGGYKETCESWCLVDEGLEST